MKEFFGKLLPSKYFVTCGKGEDPVSPLNAFDMALKDAGIEQLNLVPVSSILPKEAKEVPYTKIAPGTITFVVMARQEGVGGEEISAGVAWGFGESSEESYGFVVEEHGYIPKEECERRLKKKIERMAEIRGMKLKWYKIKAESLKISPGNFGSVVAAVVFLL